MCRATFFNIRRAYWIEHPDIKVPPAFVLFRRRRQKRNVLGGSGLDLTNTGTICNDGGVGHASIAVEMRSPWLGGSGGARAAGGKDYGKEREDVRRVHHDNTYQLFGRIKESAEYLQEKWCHIDK